MQHLGAAGRDLLRFVVMQRADEARRRRRAWIRAEHAGYVGPDLDGLRPDLRAEIGRRGVRTATTEQAGIAFGIARDEALRDDYRGRCIEPLLERGVRRKRTGCREYRRLGGSAT